MTNTPFSDRAEEGDGIMCLALGGLVAVATSPIWIPFRLTTAGRRIWRCTFGFQKWGYKNGEWRPAKETIWQSEEGHHAGGR